MSPGPRVKLSFSAKILIPVVALLILLPGIMLLVVHRSSVQQLEREARHQLRTADAVLLNCAVTDTLILCGVLRVLRSRCHVIVSDPVMNPFRSNAFFVHKYSCPDPIRSTHIPR